MSERGRGAGRWCRGCCRALWGWGCWRQPGLGRSMSPQHPGLGHEWPPSAPCPPLGGTGSPAMCPCPPAQPGCPCPTPAAEHRGTRARSSIPFPPGAEHNLGAGVTQCQSSQERVIPTCPVLRMLTWPLQQSLQGDVAPAELVSSKTW